MVISSATMSKMGFQLTYTGGGFYTWETYGPDRFTLSFEAHAVYGRVIGRSDSGCLRLPSTYSVYDGDGCFLGESEEVITSASRLRSIASAFTDRMILMSKADRFGELINLVLTNEEANYTR